MIVRLTLAALLLGTALPAAAAPAPAAAPVAATANTPAATLRALFVKSDEDSMARNPVSALFRGDPRYADQFGDYISDAYIAAEKQAAIDELAALAKIDRGSLSANDQISYDVFKWQRTTDLRGLQPDILAATVVRPIDHFNGLHLAYADLSSGEGVAPFKTVADYENNLKRLKGFDGFLDESIVRFRQGMKSGVVQPKLVVKNVIEQLDGLIAQGVTGSVFYKPVTKFPEGFSEADKIRLKNEYAAAVQNGVLPAFTRLRDFLKSDYLPVARDSVGISQMPGGAALYQYLIQSQTTTDITPEQVHALGLSEVARITGEMEKVKNTVGFKGTLQEFFVAVREDPKQHATSGQAFGDGFRTIGKQVDLKIPTLFSTIPKSPLEIRPAPAYAEKTQAAGYYNPGTPDGSRPGIFYYNTYDIKSRAAYGMETLYLHEGIPGHHFQISLAQENTDLPPFQRFGGNTAFVEGWALYAESLGAKLGMYTDPYQLYGHLDDEMLRAMRLVVDSGIHAKGWTRDQAIAYMMANSAMSRTDATAEVERYIAIPGQALAYKIGQLQIAKVRAKAEAALGPKFDIRDFHAQVLDTGALPMAVLESKIDAWIARGGGK
ncbi:DUF885 domain-containing protein [Polymorphobacter arshaanensis]|uniref:DUF885 domain-containing protein n=1 Tax=Glacieibacterium arshaanense TaxID=2511025 RepID=A0A4Y9EMK3_9SPHN|nr:DUF885 domain-containing protein [Polymorphobacter arshaanensis]TFU03257.1 DUF885 domain-containing protein [Polymorphobacter arshaanensis]